MTHSHPDNSTPDCVKPAKPDVAPVLDVDSKVLATVVWPLRYLNVGRQTHNYAGHVWWHLGCTRRTSGHHGANAPLLCAL